MSPAMHNAAFKKLGLDYVYVPFSVKSENLPKAVDGLRALNVSGFNVTIPHKVSVLPLLDGVDPLAGKIGAVNTVVNTGGKLRGFNTDAEGFYRALMGNDLATKGKNIVILGAGGASRAISYILAEKGAHLTIINRKEELSWADNIAAFIKKDLGKAVAVFELSYLAGGLSNTDILVNATSVGMYPGVDNSLVPVKFLSKIPAVVDIVYNPLETRLLREARSAGARTVSGIDMLTWQGALAFEKWTGQKAPLELMRQEAVKMLEQHEK